MSFIKSAFSSPKQAAIQTPTHTDMAQGAYGQQVAFLNALAAQNGLANQSNVYNQAENVAGQLNDMANGAGPNPAQNMLDQSTARNIAAQNALMASQRGVSSNPGLITREAAMRGADIQQQAAGQAATMNAQQRLAAYVALQNQQQLLSGLTANQVGNYGQYGQNEQNMLLNSIAQQNNASVGSNSNVNNANATNLGAALGVVGSGVKAVAAAGLGPAGGAAAGGTPTPAYKGGMINKYAHGGKIHSQTAKHLLSKKPALVGENLAAKGMTVPGKASVKGDSLKNDTVPAMLSPGEVVIPRHIMNSSNPAEGAAKFVSAILAKKAMKRKAS